MFCQVTNFMLTCVDELNNWWLWIRPTRAYIVGEGAGGVVSSFQLFLSSVDPIMQHTMRTTLGTRSFLACIVYYTQWQASLAQRRSTSYLPLEAVSSPPPPLLSSEEIFVLFCFYDSVIFHSNFTIAKGEKTESSSQRSCVFFKNFQCHRYIYLLVCGIIFWVIFGHTQTQRDTVSWADWYLKSLRMIYISKPFRCSWFL